MAARKLFEKILPGDSIALTILLILCHTALSETRESLQVCVFEKYVGRRVGGYCFIDMMKQERRKSSLEKAAEVCVSSNGTIVNESDATTPVTSQYSSQSLQQEKNRDDFPFPEDDCVNSPTGCRLMCNFPVCQLGFFDPPSCRQACSCKQPDFCDSSTGGCLNEDCYPGFHQPPLCLQQCNCLDNVPCNAKTGHCHLGCKPGWMGQECRTRICPSGRAVPPACQHECHCFNNTECDALNGTCQHGCASGWAGTKCLEKCADGACLQGCFCSNRSCEDPPGKCLCDIGFRGKYCSESKCPFGTYGPPDCSGTCFCENDRFCNPSNGDCMGTPCQGNRKGRDCHGPGCPHGFFNPPKCDMPCYCANGATCDINTGACREGCKRGWYGRFCNERLCGAGMHGLPSCDLKCHCISPSACNSLTGECERSRCSVDWTGYYCNIFAPERSAIDAYRFHSSPSFIVATLAVILVVVTALVAFSLCSNPTRKLEGTISQRELQFVEI